MRTFLLGLALLLAGFGWTSPEALAQNARVQIIHNSPVGTVDVYVNDALTLPNFAFRTATPYLSLPAGVDLKIDLRIAGAAASSPAAYTQTVRLDDGVTYSLVATGDGSAQPIALVPFVNAREAASGQGVDLLVFHGSPDAPAVDVVARGVGTLVPNFAYGAFAGYVTVPAGAYTLDIQPAGSGTTAASFLADLSGANGAAATVVASGYLAPAEGAPAFGLLAVFADGTTAMLPAPPAPSARVQIIHNSPVGTVDVYVNDALTLPNFAFRTATPYLSLPAGVDLKIDLRIAGAAASSPAAYTQTVRLDDGVTYSLVATGDGSAQPIALVPFVNAREAASGQGVDLLVFHGSPDAPAVDVVARGVGTLVPNFAYGAFAGYVTVPAGAYTLDIQPAGSGTTAASFLADLSGANGAAATVVASGYLAPAEGAPAFGLLAVFADGTTAMLPATAVTSAEGVGSAPRLQIEGVFPNPASRAAQLRVRVPATQDVHVQVFDVLGREVLSVTPAFGGADVQSVALDASSLQNGLYMIRVQADRVVASTQWVVSR